MRKTDRPKRAAQRKSARTPRRQPGRSAPARAQRRTPARARPSTGAPSRPSLQRWSAAVTRGSDALDLEPNVFAQGSARAVALSLKRSAEASHRRKAEPYRSAMSMLTFYINRAGRNLPKARLDVLQRAKGELRKAFGR